jgi:hypothetical protein
MIRVRYRLSRLFGLVVVLAGCAMALGVQAVAQADDGAQPQKPPRQARTVAQAAPPTAQSKGENLYIRISRTEDKKPKALETSIVRFEGSPGTIHEGRSVDLVGVVHIGQKEYYDEIGRRLADYDVVLYELVAPDGTRIRPEDLQRRRSVLASMQSGMKDMLNLEYQLEHIDYLSENFRHADMSPDEFAEDMKSRGDGLVKMFARMMGAGLASQAGSGGDVGMLMALMSENRSMMLKQTMAKQLIDVDVAVAGLDDASGENTLIKGRNRKAFEVLKEELAAGKKKIAVFYGAGHLDDMGQRLENDFQMTRQSSDWLQAWDLQKN